MPLDSSISHAAIRAAVQQLGEAHPWRAERLDAAGQLLIRGGWTADAGTVRFVGGVTARATHCSCQEGRHLECLHKIIVRELLPLATAIVQEQEQPPAEVLQSAVSETPPAAPEEWPPADTTRQCMVRTPTLTLWRWRPAVAVPA